MSIHISREGPVTVVTLDRPEVRNAVDAETARALHEAFVAFDEDEEARVAVFHGAHGHFCAGWDLQAGARLAGQAGGDQALGQLDFSPGDNKPPAPMGPSRLLLSKPVIAAVSGTVRLPRLIGMGHAMDLILTGRKVEAAEALQMGLANRVVPTGGARDAAVALARQLSGFPQATMRADRLSAYRQWDLPLEEALHQEWERGKQRLPDALAGAARFAAGQGRHGEFE